MSVHPPGCFSKATIQVRGPRSLNTGAALPSMKSPAMLSMLPSVAKLRSRFELVNGLAVLMTKLTVRCPEAAHTTCDRETQAKAFCTVHFLVPVAPVDLTFRFFMTRSGRYLRRARTPFVSLKKGDQDALQGQGPAVSLTSTFEHVPCQPWTTDSRILEPWNLVTSQPWGPKFSIRDSGSLEQKQHKPRSLAVPKAVA